MGELAKQVGAHTLGALELLLVSRLTDAQLVLGKLGGSLVRVGLLLVAAVPVFAVAGLFGGVLGMRRTFILHARGSKLPTDLLGLTSIRFAAEGKFEMAAIFIVLAAVLDGLDGRLARALDGASRFGAELDSLADFIERNPETIIQGRSKSPSKDAKPKEEPAAK